MVSRSVLSAGRITARRGTPLRAHKTADKRRSFDALVQAARQAVGVEARTGALCVLVNKRCKRFKAQWFDRTYLVFLPPWRSGRSDVSITMVYTHVLNRGTRSAQPSAIDVNPAALISLYGTR